MMKDSIASFYFVSAVSLLSATVLGIYYLYEREQTPSFCFVNNLQCVAAFAIFIILALEHGLDSLVSWFGDSKKFSVEDAAGEPMEHWSGQSILILSLFPLACTFHVGESSDMRLAFIAIGQSVAVCGLLGKLHKFAPDTWTLPHVLTMLYAFLAARLLGLASIMDCSQDTWLVIFFSRSSQVVMGLYMAYLFYCVVSIVADISMPQTTDAWFDLLINKNCLCFILVSGMMLFLSSHMLMLSMPPLNKEMRIGIEVLLHTGFVILTAVLPGRVIRRGLVVLKREMEYKKTFVRYISHEIR
jgi:hypothetical protein